VRDYIEELLCNEHIELPSEVALDLLSKCEEDAEYFRRIGTQHRFSGAGAIAVAKSSLKKATIIATRTTDPEVITALMDLSFREEFDGLDWCLADSTLIEDQAVLKRLHGKLLNESNHSVRNLVKVVDIEYIFEVIEKIDDIGTYPISVLATRLCDEIDAEGGYENLQRFLRLCSIELANEDYRSGKKTYRVRDAVDVIGKFIAKSGRTDLLEGLLGSCHKRAAWMLAISAWSTAEVVDENIASAAFAVVDAEEFAESQQQLIEQPRGGEIPQYPSALERRETGYTDGALRLVGKTWPGLLRKRVAELINGDPQKDLLVEVCLQSKRVDLVERLLDRQFSQDDSKSGPVLDAAQYKKAANILRTGIRYERPESSRPSVGGAVGMSYIPAGTDVRDVLKVWTKRSVHELIENLADPLRASWYSWRPSPEETSVILEACDQSYLRQAVRDGLHAYQVPDHPEPTAFAVTRPYLDALVERLSAQQVLAEHGGPVYVAIRLTEIFGEDRGKWATAWELAQRSTMNLDAVIRAATKLA
jgi:hypothetical protein